MSAASPRLPNSAPAQAHAIEDPTDTGQPSDSVTPAVVEGLTDTGPCGDSGDVEELNGEDGGIAPQDISGENQVSKGNEKEVESVHTPWATLEELLDKLFFLAVSLDNPVFISRFLLTYRRFASPRNVLLGMQKRMIELAQPQLDPSLACFAQMRLCSLLDAWMKEYPNDFAVPGTAGALSALVKQIISNTHLLHYGSDFLPLLEQLPTLQDTELSWALPVTDILDDSDNSDGGDFEDASSFVHSRASSIFGDEVPLPLTSLPQFIEPRGRRMSEPLSSMGLLGSPRLTRAHALSSASENQRNSAIPLARTPSRDLLKELLRVATHVNAMTPLDIAREITRVDLQHFLDIEPRHWLRHVLSSERKDPDLDPVSHFNSFFNRLSNWITSLILCHDRPKNRARQMEKFALVGDKLRGLNNYSGLRAVVNGISNSTFEGEPALETFSQKEIYRQYQSWDRLFQSLGSHRAYRMALSNSKGGRIPCLEVHLVDLLRAHQANPDRHADDPMKINWGKYNMMGKFISITTECQTHCRMHDKYKPDLNPDVYAVLMGPIMDEDMWPSRMAEDSVDESRLSTRAPMSIPYRYFQ